MSGLVPFFFRCRADPTARGDRLQRREGDQPDYRDTPAAVQATAPIDSGSALRISERVVLQADSREKLRQPRARHRPLRGGEGPDTIDQREIGSPKRNTLPSGSRK